ncbi:MAG: MurR/RpiR family transcriptional regulator [Pseudomonadota bacterium]
MGLKDTLRARFDGMTATQQKAARFVLEHPNDVVTASMRTVSARVEIPPATLVRFAQSLGFDGWPELKAALVQDMGLGSEPYAHKARTLVDRARDGGGLAGEIFATHHQNLDTTEHANGDALPRAAALLEKARAVHVAGFRACHPVAYSLMYVYRLFRDNVHLLDGMGGSLEMQLRALHKGDAVAVISFSPYSREAIAVARQAREAGCQVLALTDSPSSPLAMLAHEVLLFSTQSPSFFPSIAAAQALSETLLGLLVSRAGKPGVGRIESAEAQLFATGAYLPPAPSP